MAKRCINCLGTILMAIAQVGLVGCGNDRPKTVPISGVVTINGQQPGEFGKIFFTPVEAADGYNKRPASGSFDEDGSYRVMSWEPDDGLVPGRYTVSVSPADEAKTKVPQKYWQSNTSGLEVEVPVAQGKIEYNIQISAE